MLSLTFYKLLHLFGVLVLFTALGGLVAVAAAGGSNERLHKLAGMAHGIALVIVLVAGFGLVARNAFSGGWPPWVWLKLGIWALFGAATMVIHKAGRAATWLLFALPLLGAVAAWLALYRLGGG